MQIINVSHIEDALYDVDRRIAREDWEDYKPEDAANTALEWAVKAFEKASDNEGVYIG